jgi:hypothetical protein
MYVYCRRMDRAVGPCPRTAALALLGLYTSEQPSHRMQADASENMDPRILGPEQWGLLSRLLPNLFLFVGLAVNAALAFLLSHAIIPSLMVSGDAPREVGLIRRLLYPIFVASLLLTLLALGRALYLAVVFLQQFYPRFAV